MRRELVHQYRVLRVVGGEVEALSDYLPRNQCKEILSKYSDADVVSKKVFLCSLSLEDAQKKYGEKT